MAYDNEHHDRGRDDDRRVTAFNLDPSSHAHAQDGAATLVFAWNTVDPLLARSKCKT